MILWSCFEKANHIYLKKSEQSEQFASGYLHFVPVVVEFHRTIPPTSEFGISEGM